MPAFTVPQKQLNKELRSASEAIQDSEVSIDFINSEIARIKKANLSTPKISNCIEKLDKCTNAAKASLRNLKFFTKDSLNEKPMRSFVDRDSAIQIKLHCNRANEYIEQIAFYSSMRENAE